MSGRGMKPKRLCVLTADPKFWNPKDWIMLPGKEKINGILYSFQVENNGERRIEIIIAGNGRKDPCIATYVVDRNFQFSRFNGFREILDPELKEEYDRTGVREI